MLLLSPGVSTGETYTREASGSGSDRNSAVESALRRARSQISGVNCRLMSYHIQSEEPSQEHYWVALDVAFPDTTLPRVEGRGDGRDHAIRDALTSAVSMATGVEISEIFIDRMTETNGVLFEYSDLKSDSRISGRVSGYKILEEKPRKLDYEVSVRAEFRTFDNRLAVAYSLLPGGGLLYKQRRLTGFAYLGAEAALLTGAFLSREKAEDYRAKKNDPNNTFDERKFYYDKETDYHRQNRIFLGLAAGVYVLNIVHTLLIEPKDDLLMADRALRSYRPNYIPYLAAGSGAIGVGVRVRF